MALSKTLEEACNTIFQNQNYRPTTGHHIRQIPNMAVTINLQLILVNRIDMTVYGRASKYKEKNQRQILVKLIKYHRDVASLCEEDDPSEKLTMLS